MPHIAKKHAYRSTLKGRIEAEKIGAGICKPSGTIRFCRPYYERQGDYNRVEKAEHRSQNQPMFAQRRHKVRKEEEDAGRNQLM